MRVDPAVGDADVGAEPGGAGAVDHAAVGDQEVAGGVGGGRGGESATAGTARARASSRDVGRMGGSLARGRLGRGEMAPRLAIRGTPAVGNPGRAPTSNAESPTLDSRLPARQTARAACEELKVSLCCLARLAGGGPVLAGGWGTNLVRYRKFDPARRRICMAQDLKDQLASLKIDRSGADEAAGGRGKTWIWVVCGARRDRRPWGASSCVRAPPRCARRSPSRRRRARARPRC